MPTNLQKHRSKQKIYYNKNVNYSSKSNQNMISFRLKREIVKKT